MSIYEVTTESGTYQIETADPVPSPSTSDYAIGGFKGLAKGALDMFTAPADLAYNAGNYLLDAFTGQETELEGGYPSQLIAQGLESISGGQGDQTAETIGHITGNLGTMLGTPAVAANIASKTPYLAQEAPLLAKALGYGVEGAGYTVLGNSAEENPFQDIITGAALNTALPLVGGKVADALAPLANKLEQSAIGAKGSDFIRSLKNRGATVDMDGETASKLRNSIREVSESGGFQGSKNPVALYDKNTTLLNQTEDELQAVLKVADSANPDVVIPSYPITEAFIQKAAPSERAALREALEEIKLANNVELDGSLAALQETKRALYGKVYGESGAAKETLNKYIAADLKNIIETKIDDLAGAGIIPEELAGSIKALNKKSGHLQDVRPILERGFGQAEGTAPGDGLLKALRSYSGTLLAPTVIGAGVGYQSGGGTKGLLAGAALGAATSRAGRFATSSAIRSGTPKAAKLGSAALRTALGTKATQEEKKSLKQNKLATQAKELKSRSKNNPNFIDQAITKAEAKMTGNEIREDVDLNDKHMEAAKEIMDSQIKIESAGDPEAISDKGAVGLMQIMPLTAKEIAKDLGIDEYNLKDPETNKAFGTYYLAKMLKAFDGDMELALTAYHSGEGRVKGLLQQVRGKTLSDIRPYLGPAGQAYARKILNLNKNKKSVEV